MQPIRKWSAITLLRREISWIYVPTVSRRSPKELVLLKSVYRMGSVLRNTTHALSLFAHCSLRCTMLAGAPLLAGTHHRKRDSMKLPKPTLSVQAGLLLREISTWHESLRQVHTRLRLHFARPEVHQRTLRYLQA